MSRELCLRKYENTRILELLQAHLGLSSWRPYLLFLGHGPGHAAHKLVPACIAHMCEPDARVARRRFCNSTTINTNHRRRRHDHHAGRRSHRITRKSQAHELSCNLASKTCVGRRHTCDCAARLDEPAPFAVQDQIQRGPVLDRAPATSPANNRRAQT
jgi:hypothetical protein